LRVKFFGVEGGLVKSSMVGVVDLSLQEDKIKIKDKKRYKNIHFGFIFLSKINKKAKYEKKL